MKTTATNAMAARCGRIAGSLALIVLIGCATRGYERASETGSGIETLKTELAEAKNQLDASVSALDKVVTAQDPADPYEDFVEALADMEGQADTIRAQAEDVRSAGDSYFAEWEKKLASLKNDELRAKSEQRRTELVKSYDAINTTSQKTKDAYQPLMAQLNYIKDYLGLDLSPASIAGIGDQVKRVRDDAGKVKVSIDELVAALEQLSSQLATGAAAGDITPAPPKESSPAEAPDAPPAETSTADSADRDE
jgi:hypothetical protein